MKHRFLVRACLFLGKVCYFRLQCILSTLEVLMPMFPHTHICSVTIARWCPEEVVYLVHWLLESKARHIQGSRIFRGTACWTQTCRTKAVCIAMFSFCGLCCVESSSTLPSARVLENGSDQQSTGCSAARWVLVAPALRNFHTSFWVFVRKMTLIFSDVFRSCFQHVPAGQ